MDCPQGGHELVKDALRPWRAGDNADSDEDNALLLGLLSVSVSGPAPSSFSLEPARADAKVETQEGWS